MNVCRNEASVAEKRESEAAETDNSPPTQPDGQR